MVKQGRKRQFFHSSCKGKKNCFEIFWPFGWWISIFFFIALQFSKSQQKKPLHNFMHGIMHLWKKSPPSQEPLFLLMKLALFFFFSADCLHYRMNEDTLIKRAFWRVQIMQHCCCCQQILCHNQITLYQKSQKVQVIRPFLSYWVQARRTSALP